MEELRQLEDEHQKLQKEHEWLKSVFETLTAQKAEPGVIIPMAKQAAMLDTPIKNLDLVCARTIASDAQERTHSGTYRKCLSRS